MNQAIQFPDREMWDTAISKVRFPVLVNGLLSECVVSQTLLIKRYGQNETPLALFQHYRWDIEEEFEALIEQGLDNEHGFYELLDDK
ncbi:DUF1488 domain-containing protein [Providencia zhijiangensis]|uniref:DUF1488 domain-containing protein n=1 Tax=Providencia zhijiangensis TaxID=3053982 RepID=A0ABZ0N2L6_9GAMM|nr:MULTISPECIES: DUF1488 domain-containing protein [Providencia]MTC70679.1 DUF1488 family protein [Providencia sp. wls1914]MTC75518.1 DUF1488 family protein [Providencia sp. wls1919]QLR04685.1 DUF1488 domain-containing protein [Providencia rettgeri]WPA92031.1 DUF1488 domain-containing protein [Providencia sp. D4759]